MTGECRHRYVWPNGDCIACGRLATESTDLCSPRKHLMVSRTMADLLVQFRDKAKAGLDFELSDMVKALLERLGCDVSRHDREQSGGIRDAS